MCADAAQSSIRKYLDNRKRRSNDSTTSQKRVTPSTGSGKLSSKRLSVKMNYQSFTYTDLLICGYMIKLPPNIQPYATQRTMIAKILTTLKNKLNALIESPTGSGKTLGLLSASCAWLERYKKERAQSRDECKACRGGVSGGYIENNTLDQKILFGELNNTNMGDSSSKYTDTTSADSACSTESFSTLEDEFENDFCAVTSSSFASNKLEGIVSLDDSKILKKDEEEGHTCLPRVTIYYGTRTHKQISQVVREFSRLPYGQEGIIKHTILASREHMCINPAIHASDDINSKCKEFISPDGIGCSFKNSMRGKYERPSAIRRLIAQTTGKMNSIWDVEDLVEALKCSTPPLCPYFSTARVLIDDADIIFCPFSYLIDPIIRANSGLNLKNTVVILDEAHNVEDVCREAVSFTFMERELVEAAVDLYRKAAELEKELAKLDAKIVAEEGLIEIESNRIGRYKECLEMMKGHFKTIINFLNKILDWFVGISSNALQSTPMKKDRLTFTYNWEKLYMSFASNDLNIFDKMGKGTAYSGLLEAFVFITGAGNENDEFQPCLKYYKPSSGAAICVEKFLYFFKSYFRDDNHTTYKLFICIDKPFVPYAQSAAIFDLVNSSSNNMDILDMSSYDKEKEVWLNSNTRLKGYREVKPGYRVAINFWCMRPSLAYIDAFKGCRSVILASGTLSPTDTFRTELGTTFQQEMEGHQIIPDEQIFAAVIPSGPSGEKLCGTYRIINRDNRFIREISLILSHVCKIVPKGVLCFFSSYRVLDQIYESMETMGILRQIQNIKLVLKEPRRSSLMNTVMMQYENAIVNPLDFGSQCTGALMMAVFRGKVSEGIDFADDRARCVVAVGIPFPNAMDEHVVEKKKYNDDYCTKLRILSGDEWYTMQAYRALNQALGRCLRHRSDWGSILMLDERLLPTRTNPNAKKVSRWIREQLRPLTSYEHFLSELTNFVNKMETRNSQLSSDSNCSAMNVVDGEE
uniref:Helicase ATP-binding domain-containing protein n=1 Tax=Elaeophora elaphi TaxID=1147741 RepID=A0A0R3RQJ4_9BILA